MDQCYHDITVVISLRANMAAAARTLLLLITDAVHRALLPVFFLVYQGMLGNPWQPQRSSENL